MTTKEFIIKVLLKNKNEYITGEKISKELGISRAAISKSVKELKKEGYDIHSITNRGYSLMNEIDVLSKEEIYSKLLIPMDVEILNSVDSTNAYCKRLIPNQKNINRIVVSNTQTKGKGRKERNFFSPPNTGIYMSLLLNSQIKVENSLKITLAVSVAICRVLEKLTGKKPKIKWVNDIFLGDKKIAGILTEASSSFESGIIENLIIGIGINFSTEFFPEDLTNIADSIFSKKEKKTSRNELIVELTNEIVYLLNNIEEKYIIEEYIQKSIVIGKNIIVHYYDKTENAKVLGIDENGFLQILTKNGENKTLSSGEISIRPVGDETWN